jgi:hypothetical protein
MAFDGAFKLSRLSKIKLLKKGATFILVPLWMCSAFRSITYSYIPHVDVIIAASGDHIWAQ